VIPRFKVVRIVEETLSFALRGLFLYFYCPAGQIVDSLDRGHS
jgi:hypothetical protein